MPHVFSYDEEGFHTPLKDLNIPEGVELPEGNYTFEEIPQPCQKPKFDGENWIETVPKEEWPALPTLPPTVEEQLAEKEREIRLLKEQQAQMNADLTSFMDELINKGVI